MFVFTLLAVEWLCVLLLQSSGTSLCGTVLRTDEYLHCLCVLLGPVGCMRLVSKHCNVLHRRALRDDILPPCIVLFDAWTPGVVACCRRCPCVAWVWHGRFKTGPVPYGPDFFLCLVGGVWKCSGVILFLLETHVLYVGSRSVTNYCTTVQSYCKTCSKLECETEI